MKVFISFDMEGVAGIVDWAQCRAPGQPYEEGRRLLLGEVNAAIDGALAGGADEIICNDSHGLMNNLDPEALHGRATYVAGRHKPLYMMQGMDDTVDAVFMVGYHGSISGESSVLSHTYNPAVVSHVELNGVRTGESGINGLVALGCRAPVALLTGDQQTVTEGDPFFKDAERIVVKQSITRFAASSMHPEAARSLIEAGAASAVRRAATIPPPDMRCGLRVTIRSPCSGRLSGLRTSRGLRRAGNATLRRDAARCGPAGTGRRPVRLPAGLVTCRSGGGGSRVAGGAATGRASGTPPWGSRSRPG